jgi:hypothetical protein
MSGIRLFLSKLRSRPAAAVAGLLLDYATFAAMVAFFVLLWAFKWPLWLVDRMTGWRVREGVIKAIAKVAHG